MILTKEQLKEFEEVVQPVMKFLCDNFNPHVTVVINPTEAEILSASASIMFDKFVKD
jgi:intracellular sulfur oxidation DsrE/DsrF family protein